MTGHRHTIPLDDVGIRQVHGKQLVALSHLGAEQHGPLPLQLHLEPAEEARPLVIQTLLAEPNRLYIPVPVEDRKGITALQDPRAIIGPRRGRQNVVLAPNLDDFAHPSVLLTPPDVPATRSPTANESGRWTGLRTPARNRPSSARR